MKNLFYLTFLFSCASMYAQEKIYSFDNKISYDILTGYDTIYPDLGKFNVYLGKNIILGNFDGDLYYDNKFETRGVLIYDNKFFNVGINSLENNLYIKKPNYYSYYEESFDEPFRNNFFGEVIEVINSNSKSTFNNYTCNDYVIKVNENDVIKDLNLCVDIKNSLDNTSIIFPKSNIKGLIVKISDEENTGFILQKINKSNLKASFDEKKSLDEFNLELAAIKAEQESYAAIEDVDTIYPSTNYYDDPLFNYYSYANSENEKVNSAFVSIASFYNSITDLQEQDNRENAIKTTKNSAKQLVKQFKKDKLITKDESKELTNLFNTFFKEAKDFVLIEEEADTPATIDTYADDNANSDWAYSTPQEEYKSNYKKLDTDEMDFAYTGYDDQKEILETIPNYCKNINVPNFSHEEFKKNVENYLGQLCDLYISKNVYNVGITETTDALRYSFLKINELKNKLTKEEQINFDLFINNLD